MITKEEFENRINIEINELNNIITYRLINNEKYTFFRPWLNNALMMLSDLLTYVQGNNNRYPLYEKDILTIRQTFMHRMFLSDMHLITQNGLIKVIEEHDLQLEISKQKQAEKIVDGIKQKVENYDLISKEIEMIEKLSPRYPLFNDYLNTVLNNVNALDNSFKKSSRVYFDAINIVRNKIVHGVVTLKSEEKTKLEKAKLEKMISTENELQMTFEGYHLLVNNIILFFEKL